MGDQLSLGQRIGILRDHESQQDLADAIGVPRSNVRNWELDIREPKASSICKLADHFNVTSDYILGLSDDPTVDKYKQAAISSLGLSQRSIEILQVLKNDPNKLQTVDVLISSPLFLTFLNKLIETRIKIEILQDENSRLQPISDMDSVKTNRELIDLYLYRFQKELYEFFEQMLLSGEVPSVDD